MINSRRARRPLPAVVRSLSLLGLVILPARIACAQVADVISADSQGDYTTLAIEGARGSYPQRFWLVVDQDPRGLWCRDGRWRALLALRRGSIVETESTLASPLTFRDSKPYLMVRVQPIDLLHDARLRGRGTATSCAVRANSSFLAPILPESLPGLRLTP